MKWKCVDNSAYPVSLEKGKLYEALPDKEAEQHGFIRIVATCGDYLFPKDLFVSEASATAIENAVKRYSRALRELADE